jgi:hypothetical protein
LTDVHDQGKLGLRLIKTKFEKTRTVSAHYEQATGEFHFAVLLSTDGRFALYDIDRLLSVEEDLVELKADKVIKLKDRLTTVTISDLSVFNKKTA